MVALLSPHMVACQEAQVQQEHGRRGVLAHGRLGALVDGRWGRQVHRWVLRRLGWALGQHREGAQVQVAVGEFQNEKLAERQEGTW